MDLLIILLLVAVFIGMFILFGRSDSRYGFHSYNTKRHGSIPKKDSSVKAE